MEFNSLFDMLQKFKTEKDCIDYLEFLRWPDGKVVCPHCNSNRKIHHIKTRNIYKCADCKKQFSVRIGTIFEESRIPLIKWFMAIWLISSHKKGISSCQLSKDIKVTQKTAWFMLHRIRTIASKLNNGQELFNTIEIDDTYIGGKEKNRHFNKKTEDTQGRSLKTKAVVFGMVERGGASKTFVVKNLQGKTVNVIVRENVSKKAILITDEYRGYQFQKIGYNQERVNHAEKKYVMDDFHTNTIESVWALLKRSVFGIYHHISKKHLQKYLDEVTSRFNTRREKENYRIDNFLAGSQGIRLTYKGLLE
jgi:transposase-like protein